MACTGFPAQHRTKPRSVNPLERVGKEAKRCTDVVGILLKASVVRLVGAALLGIDDGWATRNRHVRLEPMAEFAPTVEGEATPREHAPIPPKAA